MLSNHVVQRNVTGVEKKGDIFKKEEEQFCLSPKSKENGHLLTVQKILQFKIDIVKCLRNKHKSLFKQIPNGALVASSTFKNLSVLLSDSNSVSNI